MDQTVVDHHGAFIWRIDNLLRDPIGARVRGQRAIRCSSRSPK
jgi:hypothetical protein